MSSYTIGAPSVPPLPDDFLDGVDGAAVVANRLSRALSSTYYQVAMMWHRLGCVVIPGTITKTPVDGMSYVRDGYADHPETWTEAHILECARRYPDATPLLLTGCGLHFRFTVVDADDPAMSPWIGREYGVTPFVVATGRDGGGNHHYYLSTGEVGGRNKIIGPDDGVITWDVGPDGSKAKGWGQTPIDVKSHHNYVVAPGATHKTGRKYLPPPTFDLEKITVDWFRAHLPVFDAKKYERHVDESALRRWAHEPVAPPTAPAGVAGGVAPPAAQTTAGQDAEPFLVWCEASPESVGLHTWWGLAVTLAAVHGAGGAAEFHRLSGLSSKYNPTEADRTWAKALRLVSAGTKPTSYLGLRRHGYPGPIPERFKSPAAFLASAGTVDVPPAVEASVPALTVEPPSNGTGGASVSMGDGWDSHPEVEQPAAEQLLCWGARAARTAAHGMRRGWGYWLRSRGMTVTRGRCGLAQVVGDAAGRTVARRLPCGAPTCYHCMSRRLGLQVAAVLHMPLVDGDRVGPPLGSRTCYLGKIVGSLKHFERRFQRTAIVTRAKLSQALRHPNDAISAITISSLNSGNSVIRGTAPRSFYDEGVHGWTAWDCDGATWVLSSATWGLSSGYETIEPSSGDEPSRIAAVVDRLARSTFSVSSGGAAAGVSMLELDAPVPGRSGPVVEGRIRKSHSLCLDVETILRLSAGTDYHVVPGSDGVSVESFAAAALALDVPVKTATGLVDEYHGGIGVVPVLDAVAVTTGPMSPAKRAAVVALAAGRPWLPGLPSIDGVDLLDF